MKKRSDKQRRNVAAAEVFRQFAWHLAGSIASGRSGDRSPPPRPQKNAANR